MKDRIKGFRKQRTMSHSNPQPHRMRRRFELSWAGAASALCLISISPTQAQPPTLTPAGDMFLCQSAAATKVVEKVRAGAQGTMVETYVKVGDSVKKGQILGHTELDATKLQLDLAEHTMNAKANVESAKGQAKAWSVTREETEEAVRRRKVEKTRLDWAIAMEAMYRGSYEAQLEAENLQIIQHDYWKDQYEKRFFRAPVDGIISEMLVEIGKPVAVATHVFTIRNEETFSIPVSVPAELANAASSLKTLPVRTADGKAVSEAVVSSVTEDPRERGSKILKLLVRANDFPATIRTKLTGMKFGVLLPTVASLDHFVE
jgi:multidrug efflux pump subunit AcrA (membrane-fusion protein)